ncbi:MAG: histidine phosphatase family protein [Nanoarchaeota archaeon]|nr:histidine phosphatase family protein [Nanoarchaeota archaeon]
MELILVRHGETVENKNNIMQGHISGTLSEEGIKQAKLVAERLKDINVIKIFTSDLARAKDTAKEIAKFHQDAQFIEDERIRERDYGIMTGMGRAESYKIANLQELGINGKPEQGESIVEVGERLSDFYNQILETNSDETIIIVSHGSSITILVGIILGRSLEESFESLVKYENTAVSEVDVDKDGNVNLVCFNCVKHL